MSYTLCFSYRDRYYVRWVHALYTEIESAGPFGEYWNNETKFLSDKYGIWATYNAEKDETTCHFEHEADAVAFRLRYA